MDSIKKLIEKNLISKISEDLYFFKSSIIKDMIYQAIPEEIKKRLHSKMAKTLEESKFLPRFLREPTILKHYSPVLIEKLKEIVNKNLIKFESKSFEEQNF